MGIKKSVFNQSIEQSIALPKPVQIQAQTVELSTLDAVSIATAPPPGYVRWSGGEGGGSFIGLFNRSASNPITWIIRLGSQEIFQQTTNPENDGNFFFSFPSFAGDSPLAIELVSGTSPDVVIHTSWGDQKLRSNEGFKVTNTNNGDATAWVKILEGPPSGMARVAAKGISGESAIEPEIFFLNFDNIDHGISIGISPDDGVSVNEVSRDASTFRGANEISSFENSWSLNEGDSLWARLTEAAGTQCQFRATYEDFPAP
jgi:hypothetical protein